LKVALVNDTRKYHVGSFLSVKTLFDNFDIIGTVPVNEDWVQHRPLLDSADLVIVNGEGTPHDGRGINLIDIALEYPAVLINTVFQNMPECSVDKFLLVSARESLSVNHLAEHGVKALMVPDLIFAQNIARPFEGAGKVVTDSVVLPHLKSVQKAHFLPMYRKRFLDDFSQYKGAVCGRFHALCIALLWGMDIGAYPSNSWKIKGAMGDIGCDNYCESDIWLDYLRIPAIPFDASNYIDMARNRIVKLFEKIRACSL